MFVNILIAGSSGLLGSSLYENFSRRSFNVKKVNRSSDDDIYFKYDLENVSIPNLNDQYDVVINCAYDYHDKSLRDSNINLIIVKNLLRMAKANEIPTFINISSMSAYDGCVSDYGNVKLKIERMVSEAGGYSFRLGLFESSRLIGLLKTIHQLSKFTPLFSVGISHPYLPQYITNLDKFGLLLMKFIKENKKYPESVYSAVNSEPIDFNELVHAVTKKPVIKIPLVLLQGIIYMYELGPLPEIRFNSDSLKGLIFSTEVPKNLIALETI